MQIGFRDRELTIRQGKMFILLKGVEHITRATRECDALIVEPRGVAGTGDAGSEMTAHNDIRI